MNLKIGWNSIPFADFNGKCVITFSEKVWPFKCKMPPIFLWVGQTTSGLHDSVNNLLGYCFYFSPWKVPPCAITPTGKRTSEKCRGSNARKEIY